MRTSTSIFIFNSAGKEQAPKSVFTTHSQDTVIPYPRFEKYYERNTHKGWKGNFF